MASGDVILEFPLGGLNESLAYQRQPPYTTPRCRNVRPRGVDTGRLRGGSRPGLVKAYTQQGAGPVRLLNSLSSYRADMSGSYVDTFSVDGELGGPNWEFQIWITALPVASGGLITVEDARADIVLKDVNPDQSREMRVVLKSCRCMRGLGLVPNTYTIYTRFSSNPFADGMHATLSFYLNDYTLAVSILQGSAVVASTVRSFNYPFTFPGTYRYDLVLTVAPGSATLEWGSFGNTVTLWHAVPPAGDRIGFGLKSSHAGQPIDLSGFEAYYASVSTAIRARSVVAGMGGALYYADASNALAAASMGGMDLGTTAAIRSAERFGQLFIADAGDYRASGTAGIIGNGIAPGASTTFGQAGIDWRTVASVGDFLWVHDAVVAAEGVYRIVAVAGDGTTITISTELADESNVRWRVLRGPKIFDPLTSPQVTSWPETIAARNALRSPALTDADNMVPAGCPLVVCWSDRIVMAGGPVFPHAIWMSRFGDPFDFYFDDDPNDPGRALYFGSDNGSVIGEPVTALVAFSNDYLLIGCENSLWVLRGDPGAGGVMSNLSYKTGIISSGAWCAGPEGQVVFMARDGLYQIAPGASSTPQALSRRPLPRQMRDIDTSQYTVQLAYDARDIGIHVFIVPNAGGVTRHWWLDWQEGTFWPVLLQSDHEPTALCVAKDTGSGQNDVLLGGRDGYIRRFSEGADSDDGESIDSEVVIGPILLGRSGYRGSLDGLEAVLGESSGAVTWEVYVGSTPEAAFNKIPASTFASGSWSAGLSTASYPMAGGGCAFVRISSSDRWEMESLLARITEHGRIRA
jgi:hypothetical protein